MHFLDGPEKIFVFLSCLHLILCNFSMIFTNFQTRRDFYWGPKPFNGGANIGVGGLWPLQYIQYCQEITYQKPRPRRVHFASALRPIRRHLAPVLRLVCVRTAGAVRLLCGHSASIVRALCVHCAGSARPLCVRGQTDAVG